MVLRVCKYFVTPQVVQINVTDVLEKILGATIAIYNNELSLKTKNPGFLVIDSTVRCI